MRGERLKIAYLKPIGFSDCESDKPLRLDSYIEIGLIPESADVESVTFNNEEQIFRIPRGSRIIKIQVGDLWPGDIRAYPTSDANVSLDNLSQFGLDSLD